MFSWTLQIWYVEVRISRSISESPLGFEITRVDCIFIHLTVYFQDLDAIINQAKEAEDVEAVDDWFADSLNEMYHRQHSLLLRKYVYSIALDKALFQQKNNYTAELRWLEPLWDHENLFEIVVVWATEGYY